MQLNNELYLQLLEQAAQSSRLRQAYDLRTTSEDGSQRMLNALLPGTKVAIHRHPSTAESAIVLFGSLDEVYYNADGSEIARYTLGTGEGLQVPEGQFHTIDVHQPTILLEVKDGAYAPALPEDILEL